MWQNPQENADLVTFTGEILNGKLDFLCSAYNIYSPDNGHTYCKKFYSKYCNNFVVFLTTFRTVGAIELKVYEN